MKYTPFGEFFRILRIKHQEVLNDAKEFLGVSCTYISSVECGKRSVPSDWEEKIHSIFPQVTVEVVEDENLPENVPARCIPDFNGNYHIAVKDSIYVGACEGIVGYRNHIVHELSHAVLYIDKNY